MERIVIFVILTVPITIISWRTLFNFKSHGFYRYLSWECILWLFASNYDHWFESPFSILHVSSWIILIIAIYMIIAGVIQIKKLGKSTETRNEKTLYQFERTTELVDTGIYHFIRHPLYSSLLFLSWGIFFKNINIELFCVTILSTIFLYLTALFDEKECVVYFGKKYSEYMKRSKRFIPYLF